MRHFPLVLQRSNWRLGQPIQDQASAGAGAADERTKEFDTMSMKNKAAPAMDAGVEAVDTMVKTGTEAAQKGFEQAQAALKQQMDEATKQAAAAQKGFEEALAFGKGNLEAFVQSSTIFTEGMQEIARATMALGQTAFAETIENAKAFAAVKSVREALDLQANLTKASTEKFVAETTKLSETSAKLAEKAMAPVIERVNLAVKTFGKPLAA
jgi:phasin family protein